MPSISSVYVDKALTNAAVARKRNKFIAEEVFPVLPVGQQSGKVFTYDPNGEAYRASDDKRAPGTEARRADFEVNTDITYFAKNHALAAVVPDEELANADAGIRPLLDRTNFLLDKLDLVKEIALVSSLPTILSSYTSSPTNKWDAYTGGSAGDPIGDLLTAIQSVMTASGATPNRIALDSLVLKAIANHPDFIDRCKYTMGPGAMQGAGPATLLGNLLSLDPEDPIKVVVASGSVKNTAVEGQTASKSRVWGENVLIYRYEPPQIGTSVLGVHVVWSAADGGAGGKRVMRMRDEKAHGEWIEASTYYDQILLKSDAGYLYTNVLNA